MHLLPTQPQVQLFKSAGGPAYAVSYVVENWSDPIGNLEVLDVHELADEFGTGTIEPRPVDQDDWHEVAAQFTVSFNDMIRRAMGTF